MRMHEFFDDFSSSSVASYYQISAGVGTIVRRNGGLHYEITRAPDGPSTATDYLTIDSLGRPQSPTRKVVLRFSGTEWVFEVCVEYDFRAKSNGRTAYVWLVNGEAADRYVDSIALVRSADLGPQSHQLALVVYDGTAEPVSIKLARTLADRYWLRVVRSGNKAAISWSDDGHAFRPIIDRFVNKASSAHTMVMNSSSFAGGASFVLRLLKLTGATPDPAPVKPMPFMLAGPEETEVSASEILDALQAGRDIDVRGCSITGLFDLSQVSSPITADIWMQDCRFNGSIVATGMVQVTGAMSFLNCRFGVVGLSNVEFAGLLSMMGCQFRADTRFIDMDFRTGANFTACIFSERPFFRASCASKSVSFYHATFLKGADLSSAIFDDLSLSDVAVQDGSMTLYRSEITGSLRWMATLQRDPQPLGNEWNFSATQIGCLTVSAGDRNNRGEYTGPARWDLDTNVYLRNATVDRLEFYNVHFAKVLDLSNAILRSKEIDTATFTDVVPGWPVETEFYSCFISYSSKDAAFASRLHSDLENNGVRCWFAPEDIKIGEEFRQRIDDAIREYDKLLLVLSEYSVRSDWVQDEAEACFERERRQRRQVLFPIRLDTAVTRTRQAWAASIRRRRHIGDFSSWRDPEAYERAFQRLLRDLKAQTTTR